MAKFKPYKILESQLDSLPIKEGQFILTTDTKKLYSDTAANTRILLSQDTITDLSISGTTITYTRLDGTTGTVNITKSNLGLGNVENKSSATIRGELTSANVTSALGYTPINSTLKGANGGLAELDDAGKVPTSQLPSYVDDVLEYDVKTSFPATGETGKIYIDKTTNKTYRWGGSDYAEISSSLALGTTSSTAFRGDYGQAAYTHAVTNKGSKFDSGLYKIATNAEGHVTGATAVAKSDITALGIPAQDTTYDVASTTASGLISADMVTKLNGIATGATKNSASSTTPKANGTATVGSESAYARGDHVHPLQTTVSGNAGSATKLQSAVDINGVSFDGTSDITITANFTENALTDANLDEVTTPGYYYAGGANKVTNKPNNVDAFGLVVYKTASGYVTQELTEGNKNAGYKYIRQFDNSTWSGWIRMKYTDTTYTFTNGLSKSGSTVSNSGVRSVGTGTANGTISVNTNGTVADVAVKGLSNAAYKNIDTTISATSTSTNLPTSAAVASLVATETEGMVISSNRTVANIISLTKAEYDALETKEINTLYNIIDETDSIKTVTTASTSLTGTLPDSL